MRLLLRLAWMLSTGCLIGSLVASRNGHADELFITAFFSAFGLHVLLKAAVAVQATAVLWIALRAPWSRLLKPRSIAHA